MSALDWILRHLWVLLVIGGLVVRALQALGAKGRGGVKPTEAPPRRREFVEAEERDRQRRVREEIQRRIAERRGGAKAAPAASPPPLPAGDRSPEATTPPPAVLELPPVIRRALGDRMAELFQPVAAPEPPPVPAAAVDAEAARQAALAEELRAAVARKQARDQRMGGGLGPENDPAYAMTAASEAAVVDDLRNPATLRRAILAREILGPPVALR